MKMYYLIFYFVVDTVVILFHTEKYRKGYDT